MTEFFGFEVKRLPYGPLTILPLSLGILAMMFNAVAVYGCKFAKQTISGSFTEEESVFGVWKYEDNNKVCVSFRVFEDEELDSLIDGPIKFGRAISIFMGFIGFPLLLPLIFSTFLEIPRIVKLVTWISMYVMAFLTLMLFVMFATDVCDGENSTLELEVSCKPAAGGVLNSLAIFLWIGAGVSFMLLKPHDPTKPKKSKQKADEDVSKGASETPVTAPTPTPGETEVTITIKESKDGSKTKTTTTTTMESDGTKKITEKIETIAAGNDSDDDGADM